jgi:hypothetical protein
MRQQSAMTFVMWRSPPVMVIPGKSTVEAALDSLPLSGPDSDDLSCFCHET